MAKSEAQTRSELIDQQLTLSGWNVRDPTQVVEEFDILTSLPEGVAQPRTPYEGHQFSDYVLPGKDRKPLADVGLQDEGYFDALVRMFEQALKAIAVLPDGQRPTLYARLDEVGDAPATTSVTASAMTWMNCWSSMESMTE
jgi:hypothetical protein